MAAHNEIGKRGEELARSFLDQKGYEILEVNYRYSRAEVDLIARNNEALVFVEVKTRTGNYAGSPETSVNKHKEEMLVEAADHYMAENNLDTEIRFDIISILMQPGGHEIHHIEDAFFPYDMDVEPEL